MSRYTKELAKTAKQTFQTKEGLLLIVLAAGFNFAAVYFIHGGVNWPLSIASALGSIIVLVFGSAGGNVIRNNVLDECLNQAKSNKSATFSVMTEDYIKIGEINGQDLHLADWSAKNDKSLAVRQIINIAYSLIKTMAITISFIPTIAVIIGLFLIAGMEPSEIEGMAVSDVLRSLQNETFISLIGVMAICTMMTYIVINMKLPGFKNIYQLEFKRNLSRKVPQLSFVDSFSIARKIEINSAELVKEG